tara:strand:+ start:432 stop:1286 length:855 start_codon:yes stop_codon:yes gene_type:complete
MDDYAPALRAEDVRSEYAPSEVLVYTATSLSNGGCTSRAQLTVLLDNLAPGIKYLEGDLWFNGAGCCPTVEEWAVFGRLEAITGDVRLNADFCHSLNFSSLRVAHEVYMSGAQCAPVVRFPSLVTCGELQLHCDDTPSYEFPVLVRVRRFAMSDQKDWFVRSSNGTAYLPALRVSDSMRLADGHSVFLPALEFVARHVWISHPAYVHMPATILIGGGPDNTAYVFDYQRDCVNRRALMRTQYGPICSMHGDLAFLRPGRSGTDGRPVCVCCPLATTPYLEQCRS